MSKLIRFQPLTALAITGLAISTLTAGCSDNPLAAAADGLCCKQFSVGADLSGADFGLEGQVDGQFKAFAQAGSDLAVVANGAMLDVSVACENIARDLGAEKAAIDKAEAMDGAAAVTEWCNLADAQIKATFTAAAKLSVTVQPAVCQISVNAQASCEGSCSVDASCDATAEPPTCEGGKLTVECNGSCEAKGNASVSCTGGCTGMCSGSCTAKAGATVECDGVCEGNCAAGAGGGTDTGIQADGSCKGTCEGTCTFKAGVEAMCEGTCDGSCDAACEAQADVKFTCDGECKGEFEAPKCEGGKLELACKADADCKANCSASASAKAECKPPSIEITATATAATQAKINAGLASLKVNLPNLLIVFQARGQAFLAGIEASVNAGGKLVADPGELSGEAALCILPIAAAIGEASGNFKAAFQASGKVVGSVGVK